MARCAPLPGQPRTAAKPKASRARLILHLSVVAVAHMLAVVPGTAAGGPDAQTAGSLPRVRIAVVGPSDGAQAKTTEAIAGGARETAKWLTMLSERDQRTQGLGTRMLPARYEVTIKDDGCDVAKAETVAKEIVAEKFDLVLGHPCPKAALAAAKVYGAAGVAYIATETRHPDMTAKRAGPSIFRLSGRDDAQGMDAARYLAAAHGGKSIAIVHDRTLYAKAIAEQATAALKEQKIETVTATIVAGDKEYGKLVAKIKDAGAVFFAGFPLEAGFILQELRAAGSTEPFLATESVGTDEFVSTFPEAAQQVSVLRPLPLTHHHSLAGGRTAVRLYAQALAVAFGPVKDAAGWRARINDALARYRHPLFETDFAGTLFPDDLPNITFDASGNANLNSYKLVRWNGTAWQPAEALR